MLNEKKFKKALKKCGIKKNDNVYITTSLFSLGKTKFKNKKQYYHFFYKCLKDIIGNKSTIIIDAFSTNVVRDNKIHRGKHNECTTGGFAKYIIGLKDTMISDHPAHAIAANGKLAKYLCKNISKSNYGLDSGLYNILKIKSKILRIGIDFTISSIAHVAESMLGVPYFYQKLIKIRAKRNKKVKFCHYTMFVRHLDLITIYDNEKIKKGIFKACGAKKAKLNKGFIYSVDTKKYFEFIKNQLKKNPHYLLKKIPNYKYGKIPFDGPSRGRDSIEK
tara:strand:+ start:878 stop:1705 length:828 start_codon:yes stop_codon:yes gene_type:complete